MQRTAELSYRKAHWRQHGYGKTMQRCRMPALRYSAWGAAIPCKPCLDPNRL